VGGGGAVSRFEKFLEAYKSPVTYWLMRNAGRDKCMFDSIRNVHEFAVDRNQTNSVAQNVCETFWVNVSNRE
jgi:hypothetical protein